MPRFTVHRYHDPAAFQRDVAPFLLANEAANGLPLGLIAGLQAGEWPGAYMALVERRDAGSGSVGADHGVPALVALRTPPYNLVLCEPSDPAALEALADDMSSIPDAPGLPGVHGPVEVARAFASRWAERHGLRVRAGPEQRVFRCAQVSEVSGVEGALRPVMDTEHPLVLRWLEAFHAEAFPGEPFDAQAAADRWMSAANRALYMWEVGGTPVSMAGVTGPTPHSIRIVAVYTPAEQRRRGYASAAVAELTQRMLDDGREFCTLFTDLANPTSNKIYREIGYRPVIDFTMFRFAEDRAGEAAERV